MRKNEVAQSKAKIRAVQHCAATSATAELLFFGAVSFNDGAVATLLRCVLNTCNATAKTFSQTVRTFVRSSAHFSEK